MPKNRKSKTNNPEGYNQFNSAWMDSARDRPAATAAIAAAALGAGLFLWSRRSQISEQLSQIGGQIGEWNANESPDSEFETVGNGSSFSETRDFGSTGDGISPSSMTTNLPIAVETDQELA
jgi:hypothetical protein